MIHTCLLFCALLAPSYSYSDSSQNKVIEYHQKCNEALEQKVIENYASAIIAYEEAFQIFQPFYDDMAHLLDCYKAVKDSIKYNSFVYTMQKAGYYTAHEYHIVCPGMPITERDNQRIPKTFAGDTIENKAVFTDIKSQNAMAMEAFTTIEAFIAYARPAVSISRGNKDGPCVDGLRIAGGELLMNCLQSGRFANRAESNVWESGKFATHITHIFQTLNRNDTKRELMDALYAILWEQVLAGNLSPAQYAVFWDAPTSNSGKTLYGAARFIGSVDDKAQIVKMAFPDIEDIKNVDKRRADLLLPPLWVFAKNLGMDLPKGYKK